VASDRSRWLVFGGGAGELLESLQFYQIGGTKDMESNIYSNVCCVFGNVVSEPDSQLSGISFRPSIMSLWAPPAPWEAPTKFIQRLPTKT
jgi:hypothetical protein